MNKKVLLAILFAGSIAFSCSKDEEAPAPVAETPAPTPTPTPTGNTTGSTTPNFNGADASLWAVKSLSVTTIPGLPPVTTTIGLGVAAFNDGSSNLVSAGTVMLNSTTLTLNSNNSYTNTIGTTNPTGIDFTSGVSWDVSGANGFNAFTKNVTLPFPTVSEVTSSATITKSSGYTLTVNTVTGADSVMFLIGGVSKTLAGNATSCTFSSSDLSSLNNGTTVVQVAAYTYNSETIGAKTIYFGNETVQSKTATVE
ncbi:MAG TPA: hypothetical protein PK649_13345 [Vicingus sp.]|nr:hypothetical protein [Vicingus sp.]